MKYLAIPFFVLTIALSGCNNVSNSKIEDYANTYMEHFKKSDFALMYDMFYEKAAAEMTYAKFEATHKSIIDRIGSIKEVKKGRLTGATYSFGCNKYEVVYDINFEKYKGLYGIKILSSGNKLQIIGWYIESEGLLQ